MNHFCLLSCFLHLYSLFLFLLIFIIFLLLGVDLNWSDEKKIEGMIDPDVVPELRINFNTLSKVKFFILPIRVLYSNEPNKFDFFY